jgi:hypothetical protein
LSTSFVKDIVKDKLNVKVDPSEIQAIHRIPGKIGEARPVIVKLVNSEVKYSMICACSDHGQSRYQI